ncbi:MAG: hypothetical protein AAF419_02520 [Pseudomonadota bacterium]
MNSNKDKRNLNSDTEQISILLSALTEAQTSVRAFDTKAQIVGIGYIFTIGIIGTIGSRNPEQYDFSVLTIVFAWLLVIMPIVQFGAVLYPSRKLAPMLGDKASHVKRIYHVSLEYIKDIDQYLSDIESCDIKAELSYELMKVSGLRDLKRIRFIRGLFLSSISFFMLFLSQLFLSLGTKFF